VSCFHDKGKGYVTKQIPLGRGMFALVDDEDYDRLSQWRWSAVRGKGDNFYASRAAPRELPSGKMGSTSRQMQREILDPDRLVPGSRKVDHINRNGLDNRRENLRWASNSLNTLNRVDPRTNKTGYRGVYFDSRKRSYWIRLKVDGRIVSGGGSWVDPGDAAREYNRLALLHHGADATLNAVGQRPDLLARLSRSAERLAKCKWKNLRVDLLEAIGEIERLRRELSGS